MSPSGARRPRLAFVGLGWIGAMRLEAVAERGAAEVAALCDTDRARLEQVGQRHPGALGFEHYDELLDAAPELGLDGVVIATPNADHPAQTIPALERGLAVFCQKPLATRSADAAAMVAAARAADRLLGVDYSYRHTDGLLALRRMVRDGELGRVFMIRAVFHNAYGPDKAWCRDPERSGGGALIDLGVHLVDQALWLLERDDVRAAHGRVFRGGVPIESAPVIDDFATAALHLEDGPAVELAVSWNAHAGRDCVIRTTVYGTAGGAEFRNVDSSFYDFEVERFTGREGRIVLRESRDWLGRCILDWTERLARSPGYDPEIERSVRVAEIIEAVYAGGRAPAAVT